MQDRQRDAGRLAGLSANKQVQPLADRRKNVALGCDFCHRRVSFQGALSSDIHILLLLS
jgi:hypothetical protein